MANTRIVMFAAPKSRKKITAKDVAKKLATNESRTILLNAALAAPTPPKNFSDIRPLLKGVFILKIKSVKYIYTF